MMNPYKHKEISNHLDHRIVDVFVNQNPCNEWLVSADVTTWVFQTNKTTAYQQNYVYTKLFALLGMEYTIEVEQSFLERTRIQQGEFKVDAFRLKDATLVKADIALPSLEEQIEDVFTIQSAQRQ
ncbi:hypothetical protein SynSYN20_00816 [Synechococcus sp. SYN20]|nr:hypothetical protein SynSYN20_00816 [Synechococcus sp. SYN20]